MWKEKDRAMKSTNFYINWRKLAAFTMAICLLLVFSACGSSPKQEGETVYISAKSKENIEELKEKIYDIAKDIHSARFPFNDFLYRDFEIDEETK